MLTERASDIKFFYFNKCDTNYKQILKYEGQG